MRFKNFVAERLELKHKKYSGKFSHYLVDFLDHLMSPTVTKNAGSEKSLKEITLVDKRPKGKQVPVPNVLTHDAVTQRDVAVHANRYKAAMENGKRIASEHGNVYKHIRSGFNAHMDAVEAGHDPHKMATTARTHHAAYRLSKFGYTSGSPKFLGKNTKIKKNEKQSENSTGLSLAPYTMHGIPGHSSCIKASTGCRNSCLAYTTGQNAMLSNINSKISKHQYMAEHPQHAAAQIHSEMLKHVDKTIKENKGKKPDEKSTVGFRMNVTSDYPMQHMMGRMLDHVHAHAQKNNVDMKVRDYTKHAERLYQKRPSYHFMALSHTGTGHDESNDADVSKALAHGHTVASIVRGDATHFYDHSNKRLYPIAEGDHDDMIENRHAEVGHKTMPDNTGVDKKTNKPTGVVSVLRIKGISTKVKEAAGDFENQTTTINHPKHGKMNVVEINKPKKA